MPVADRRDTAVQDRAHGRRWTQLVDDELLGELGEQAGDLLERRLRPAAVAKVDREVDAPGERRGVGDPERDHALRRPAPGSRRERDAEQERQLAVVDRDLGDGGVDGPEPEREPRAVARELAAAVMEHVRGWARRGGDAQEKG